jgi:threonine aldolase
MADAEVGDDVLDGDPTTRRLEERVAQLLGKEAALFLPSGTQANAVGIRVNTRPGTEMIVEREAHIVRYEESGAAVLAGVQLHTIHAPDGRLDRHLVAGALRSGSRYLSRTSAVSIEITHNAAGGTVTPLGSLAGIAALAAEHGLGVHLDGARLWNAAAALGVALEQFARHSTTVMVSFSKGLGCPVGSCLAGPRLLMDEAWRVRKQLGGGMRQSGVLSAACLYALDHNLDRLAQDHQHARRLADRLAGLRSLAVTPPETNIVMLDLADRAAGDAALLLEQAGVRLAVYGPRRLRAVTHLDVSAADVDHAADLITQVLT